MILCHNFRLAGVRRARQDASLRTGNGLYHHNRIGQSDTFCMRGARRRARRDVPPWKEAGQREDGANTASTVKQLWQAAGHEPHTGIMILAPAMRHSVGRPATGMGGGI